MFYDIIPLNCFISDAALFIMPAPFLMYPLMPFKLKPSGVGVSEICINPNSIIAFLLIKYTIASKTQQNFESFQCLPPIVGSILSSYVPCISSNMSAMPVVLPEYF